MKQILLILCAVVPFIMFSQQTTLKPSKGKELIYLGTSKALKEISPVRDTGPLTEKPEFDHDASQHCPGFTVQEDRVTQDSFITNDPIVIDRNFEGVSSFYVSNPDTEGDVGPNHYFQMVKRSFMIWDKEGTLLYGPADNNTLWSSFPGLWHDYTWTDPIVIYDHLSDRWLASGMVYNLGVEYWEMIAVSATPDPLGEWHCYSLWFDKMPDYPKFGLWPDGYYLTINEYIITPEITAFFDGASILVFNRDELMNGENDPTVLYFHHPAPNQHIGEDISSFQPSDLDGPPPLTGTPNYHVCLKDDDWGWEQDRLWIWECVVDWEDTASSHFSEVAVLETEPFTTNFDQMDFIHQPGTTTRLHSLSHFLMYRLQFRQFDNYQTLLANHTIMTGINQKGAVRWYELRNEGSGWTIYQQSTFAPDEHSRWMGSMAMDMDGNIALGYSVSSDDIYPSIRATGRYYDDPASLMTFQEANVIDGGGNQTPNPRWGDYSTMSVDPVDDLTFWYTQEYIEISGNLRWKTRVCSFQLHRNLDFSVDSLVFMNYDECMNGKQLILKNNSSYDVELMDIEQEGYFMYGASWYIDPYGFNFPISMSVGDSVELTIKVDFLTVNPQTGFTIDTMGVSTDYKDYGFPLFLNDSLIVGLEQEPSSENDMIRLYPNPFNRNLSIELQIENAGPVSIEILNLENSVVKGLLNNAHLGKGIHYMKWDGTDMLGGKVAKGIYFVKFRQRELELYKKVILQ